MHPQPSRPPTQQPSLGPMYAQLAQLQLQQPALQSHSHSHSHSQQTHVQQTQQPALTLPQQQQLQQQQLQQLYQQQPALVQQQRQQVARAQSVAHHPSAASPRKQHQQAQHHAQHIQQGHLSMQSFVASPRQLAQLAQHFYIPSSASNGHPNGSTNAPIATFRQGSPTVAMAARTSTNNTIIRPPIVISGGTMISSPGLARMHVVGNARPVFVAAGPPSIIKNPMRTKLLLERPVPRINIEQRSNTLLSDFWSPDIDINKDGKVVKMKERIRSVEYRRRTPKKTGIVVGIDFGNTFTAVSYAHQNDGEMIDIVKWPKHLNAYAKVPTVSLYNTSENRALVDWGSSAIASYKRSKTDRVLIRDYKLQLFDQGARGRLGHGLHLTDVFTQYIQSIHRHLLEEVNKSQVLSAESMPMHYCVTIPQAWTIPTRELVLRCYVEAGVVQQTPAPNMTVITEAEAAATYCREHCVEFESLQDGDIFMICDAGGLTTHVTTFKVDDSLGVRQFMRLSSSHAEDCGSVMLDRRFKELVLGRLAGLDVEAKPQRQKAFETLLEGFDEIKSQLDANAKDETKHILVPMGLDVSELVPAPSWLEDEYMSLSGQELCEVVFDPVVNKVLDLVREQSKVHPVCACLFLVGGFGSNKYLHWQLQLSTAEAISAKENESGAGSGGASAHGGGEGVVQKVVMVQKAELAVARGAVIYGLKSAAQQNKAFL